MQKLTRIAALAAVLVVSVPGVADAARLWVSGTTPAGADKSCDSPGYSTVQSALNAAPAGAAVEVCGGTYTEQLEITKPVKVGMVVGSGIAKLLMPSTPSDSLTACDTAAGLEPGQKDEISVCTPGKVSITGIRITALAPIETCAGGLYGIFVGDGAELSAQLDTIDGASTTLDSYKGCQHGVAVEVGSARAGEVGHAILKNDVVEGYEKNGPTVAGEGSTLKVLASAVIGEGASPYIAQNGIEVAYGAKGTVKETNVLDNECELSGVCSASELEEQAAGVLFYGAAAGSSVADSEIAGNDLGVYYSSTSATQPSSPEVKVSNDTFKSDRYEGAVLEEGDASLSGDLIEGTGLIGIDVVQAGYQHYADDSSANAMRIEGMSDAAVEVTSDGEATDPSGSFTIKNSSISKNAAQVIDPSATFAVIAKKDS